MEKNFYKYLLQKSRLNGTDLIAAERLRQIKEEGYSSTRDDEYWDEQLVEAAMVYAVSPYKVNHKKFCQIFWPKDWGKSWYKKHKDHRITQLIKAGALLAAEIDRLLRSELEDIEREAEVSKKKKKEVPSNEWSLQEISELTKDTKPLWTRDELK